MDKAETGKQKKLSIRVLIPRIVKALVKTVIIYIIFAIFSTFMIPFEGIYNYETLFTVLFALYLLFVFIIELTRDTIFHHIFSIANSLMIVFYFSYVLNTGVINFTVEQINLMIDVRFFLALFVIGGMLGFAKSILQLLSWMNEREEQWLRVQIKSL